ncbi:PAS domain-containing protein [Poseidonibacter antarcticus]|uniref:PAS domain-containing protein n=1 Tax=Poseidonibacter antarcticus TaxID=2478538 RepID=UPI000EF4BFEF|nr:PAS domain-containing protein [Poseidonibacter antarcticus]
MFLKKKKFYTLSDIQKRIVYTPLFFVVLLAFVSSMVLYFFFTYEKNSKIKLLIQSENFYKKDGLKNYISNIKYNTSANFDDVEIELSNNVYELNGYIKSSKFDNKQLNLERFKKYITNLENNTDISFLLFDTKNYNILHGNYLVENLSRLTNSQIKTNSFIKHMLENIQYMGDNNLIYWIDNEKQNIQLSYFKYVKGKELFLGAFSKVDDMTFLTKKVILDTIQAKSKDINNGYFTFYDKNKGTVFNYYGKGEVKEVKNLRNFVDVKNKSLSYTFPKYQYEIFVKETFLEDEIKKIKGDYEYKIIMSILTVIFIALLLITTSNIFGRFINTIFNRYNRRVKTKNVLYKKWKERYELAIIASNDGLWDINLETNEIFFSNKWLDMFGYKRDDIQNFEQWSNLIHKDDKNKVLKKYQAHLKSKSGHFTCEYRLKTKSNQYKWILVRGKAFKRDNSNRMLMMSMDIDSRMKLTKELRNVELLTEFGRIVIFRCLNDEKLTVKFVSKSINTYGYKESDFMNGNIEYFDLVHKDDVKGLKNVIKKAIENNADSFTSIHRIIDSSKDIKWIYNRSILIRDDYGKVTSLYGYLNDITKMKLNEEELKQKVELELEKNMKKDRLLVQQNKLASMGEMLGNISHQWRQPLNNINLLLYFIRDNFENFSKEELNDSIKSAKIQIDYMSQTIDDFRNFYQPTKDKKIFDIKDSIIKSSKIIQALFERNEISLTIDGIDIEINNYENEFEQVIVNILTNANDAKLIKAKENKFNAKVLINVSKIDEFIIISIWNNCGNAEKEVLDKMFEPYFTTKFENQGTGIGLYMTKIIIEKNMNGTIDAYNKDDGVEFLIKLRC